MKREEGPFIRSTETTATIMRDVAFALVPAALFGVYRFGFRAFLILLLSVTSCVLAEHVCKRIRKSQRGGYECSAVVTGLLLGMMLPAQVPYWFPVAGGVLAVVVMKMLFGGLGRNLFNLAVSAKFLFLILTGFVMKDIPKGYVDAWKEGTLSELFFGIGDGMIGEVSVFLLLLGGLYLALCKVIYLRVPLAYLLVFTVLTGVFGEYGFAPDFLARQVCNGSLVLGAFFLANDYSTTPMTKVGKLLFGAVTGGITGVLYVLGYKTEAVPLGILCGNLLTPLLDKMTFPRHCGNGKNKRK